MILQQALARLNFYSVVVLLEKEARSKNIIQTLMTALRRLASFLRKIWTSRA